MFGKTVKATMLGLVAALMIGTGHAQAEAAASAPAAPAAAKAQPQVTAGVPFFYYQDLPKAADWYENKLGLRKVTDRGWVVIFEITPSSYIGLVNATGGTFRPAEHKAAMLSIETQDVDAWWNHLKDVKGINITQGIEIGAHGMIREFRMVDPGGYVVEFYSWNKEFQPANDN